VPGRGWPADFIKVEKPILLGFAKTMTALMNHIKGLRRDGFLWVAEGAAILHNSCYN
jgi:hypothetical protein